MIYYPVGGAGGLESDGTGRGSCSSGQCWECGSCSVPLLVLLELSGRAWGKETWETHSAFALFLHHSIQS